MSCLVNSDCIPFRGSRSPKGYGRKNIGGRVQLAHRLAWEQTHGPIPSGMFVLHHCDNPPCTNVDHLYLGTHTENMADARHRGTRLQKLTLQQVQQIEESTNSPNTLARRYGVSRRRIRQIKQGAKQPPTKEPTP